MAQCGDLAGVTSLFGLGGAQLVLAPSIGDLIDQFHPVFDAVLVVVINEMLLAFLFCSFLSCFVPFFPVLFPFSFPSYFLPFFLSFIFSAIFPFFLPRTAKYKHSDRVKETDQAREPKENNEKPTTQRYGNPQWQ